MGVRTLLADWTVTGYLCPGASEFLPARQVSSYSLDGGNVRQYLDKTRKGEPIPFDHSTIGIAWVIVNALAELHRNGFLHRDLNCLNLLYV
ncbi:hypothetical protein SPRG_13052 [Saprolegnia parasitica CBS 223.65]|uniref:Protein kinase domain-containing protein n=1 Tax=Saprolegnia parasitica (strain CBS 223.65) TaxID=695850 RepID=A0A067C053_SAPPC|nr:hypothetical protein SPRG_13052 [Saprolegnia parasitica CBS 223.65]KDO19946.1 hypothetical protein SPRG_13052 [Saprolegnia parasitica CBS 223.65]|eukprot:XP_012209318.1 hypothetical protein SPRG_13052 [Saprolegnia parasitica CBS 223.65]